MRINELSNKKLGKYKKAAGADASAADKQGNTKRANKRFKGILKATNKEFDNDLKKHEVSEELTMKHQRDHRTQKYADNSNSLAQRSVGQAEVPNVTKSADGHPTVKGRTDSTRRTAHTRVEPTITPTTVKRKDADRPIPSFLQKEVAEDLDANQKRAGQLGPTQKVGKKGAVGKLVGACESIEESELTEEQLLAKKLMDEWLKSKDEKPKDRELSKKPRDREIQKKK